MAKRKDCLRIKELNGGSKKTEKVEKTNQKVQEQLKEAQEQTNNFLNDPSEEEDAKRLSELKKAIDEIAKRAKAKAKSKAESDAKEAEKAEANKADGKPMIAAELEAEAQRWQKAIEDGSKAFEAKKAEGIAKVKSLRAEAKRVAAEEEKARLAAIEAARAKEAKKAAEAKKAEEAARLEKEAREAVCNPGPKKVYQFRSPKTKEIHTTSDIWAAEQAAPGRWKAVWVWVGSNGKVHHVLTPEEIAEFVQ